MRYTVWSTEGGFDLRPVIITGRLQNPMNFEDFCSTFRRRRSCRSLFESPSSSVTNFFLGAFTIARGVSASETAEIILGLEIVLVSTCAGAGVAARARNFAFVLVWPFRSGKPVFSSSLCLSLCLSLCMYVCIGTWTSKLYNVLIFMTHCH